MTTPDHATTLAMKRLAEVETALAQGLDTIQAPTLDHGGFTLGLDSLSLSQQRELWRTWLARHAMPVELRKEYQASERQ